MSPVERSMLRNAIERLRARARYLEALAWGEMVAAKELHATEPHLMDLRRVADAAEKVLTNG